MINLCPSTKAAISLCIRSQSVADIATAYSLVIKLLGFDGCEFYVRHHEELVGATFGDALLRFDAAVPIGVIQRGGGGGAPVVHINPDDDFVLDHKSDLVVVAEDDDTYAVDNSGIVESTLEGKSQTVLRAQQHFLGVDLTTTPMNVPGAGTLIGQAPIRFEETCHYVAGDSAARTPRSLTSL